MHPKVSIIIPCYNSERTLNETLQSVFDQDYEAWEAIMVNDGSPDNLEAVALEWVEKDDRFKYYKKTNGGLGSARNYGLKKASGTYVLPLDSDNMVRPEFVNMAIDVLDSQNQIGVVYGNAMYFGEKTGIWNVGAFDHYKMLNHNFIDACAVVRKSLFDSIGGYEENLPHQGHEDWDFWLCIMKTDFEFMYLNKITFDYRVSGSSMIRSFSDNMALENINYIQQKHSELYIHAYQKVYLENKYLKRELSTSVIRKVFKKLKSL
ncbi:glycosyltransferase family 2 protein [Winogradskyella pacifica]|uniref:glycosyltransferase family 2 protein n=1 Tax=Winogradskyella pacifica TaxID=664642 RepID=UPI0015C907A2|nr:glycosyltransferase family A protein [Winogradskyella pacifica]